LISSGSATAGGSSSAGTESRGLLLEVLDTLGKISKLCAQFCELLGGNLHGIETKAN
jgi:hypothetical protein